MFVAQSGLVLICLVARQMGCTLWSDHQWGRIWGRAVPLHNHRATKGVAKNKMHPLPHFLLCPSVPPLLLLLTTIAPPLGLWLIRIAENFRAEGAKKYNFGPFFGHFWYISGPNFFLTTLIEATLRIRAYAGIFRGFL